MDKVDFLEKLYFHELDRKQSLESMFALPAGIIAGLFGVVGYFFTHYNFASANLPNGLVLQFLFVLASGCAFVA
jgi:VIT1/CCC1 family predicted Fe2+/Mn2+ transporter